MSLDPDALPDLTQLHERHYGHSPPVCAAYAEAASVCLARYWQPPTLFTIDREDREQQSIRRLDWTIPTERTKASWANQEDSTRDGAYAVALGAVEAEYSLFAVSRAETKSGADNYLGDSTDIGTDDDLENKYRLEVAGRASSVADVKKTLEQKIEQTKSGRSSLPAIACVVGFKSRFIAIAKSGETS